jgi:Helix-turn-helix of DDE superfamily endonuclease
MSKYEKLCKQKPKDFKRLIGVKEETFATMIEVFREYNQERKKSLGVGGRKSLPPEDKVLLTLGYYREYRTLEHIGFDYGVSEATASRIVKEVEEVLIKSGKFSLPSKRELYKSDVAFEFVVIDATETPCQRPKKSKKGTIQERKNNTPSKDK